MEQYTGSMRDRLLIRLLFHLGCRVSEVLALNISDIDFAQKTITILHLKTRTKLSCPKCGASLDRRHRFCPECGEEIEVITIQNQKYRRIRMSPVDEETLRLIERYITEYKPMTVDDSW